MNSKPKLGDLLVQAGAIDDAQLKSALGEQRQWGKPLGMTLVRMGFLDEETLVHTLASQLKIPVVKLSGKRVNPEVLERVPIDLAEKHRCIPLLENDEGGQKVLYLGMEDPADLEALDELGFRVGERVKPVLVAPSELDAALQRHYHWATQSAGTAEPIAPRDEEEEPEFSEIGSAPEPSFEAAPEPPALARPPAKQSAVPPEVILRALGQLLIEKGILTRDELVERVRAVVSHEDR
jgi:type IV pilus assembly protein PilB